jgi:uncharacterized membrane protein/protein-disulfide isomerase
MTRTAGLLALAFALLGLTSSGIATYVHTQLLNNPSYLSFCDVSAVVSCTDVYSSQYGSVAGIPVAVFGTIWFALAALLAVAALKAPSPVREDVPAYLFVGSTLALSAVIYLAYTSFVVLNMLCVVCLVTYVAVVGLFLVSGGTSSVPLRSLPGRVLADFKALLSSRLALTVSLLFVVGAGSALAFFPYEARRSAEAAPAEAAPAESSAPAADQSESVQFERWFTSQPRKPIVVPTEGAKVLIVKFNDYQCPPCRQTYMDYKSVFAKYESAQPGAVRLVLRDFPLEKECNAGVSSEFHAASCEAAAAVRMARERNRAEALEEWLFGNQPAMTPQSVREAARTVGQVPDFDARYQATLEAVKSDIAFGRQLGVGSTPTFFINGVMITGGLPAHLFEQAIALELKRAG